MRRIRLAPCIVLVVVALTVAVPPAARAQPVHETVHEFVQGPGVVQGRLLQAADGHLYGVASRGGAFSGGTVFVIRQTAGGWSPAETLRNLRQADGIHPYGGLVQGAPGVFYGTTTGGGAFGGGTVFRIDAAGSFQLIASLNPPVHGAFPITELTWGPSGELYGTASQGGAFGGGTVFRISPLGSLSVMHAFTGATGAVPSGALTIAPDGHLYGTTFFGGGARNGGGVFRLTRSGAFTLLQGFNFRSTNSRPRGRLALALDGALYGTTTAGPDPPPPGDIAFVGGIFKVTPATGAVEHVVTLVESTASYSLSSGMTLGADGSLYGLSDPAGGLFRFRPSPALFEWIDGGSPLFVGAGRLGAPIFASDGRLYATTATGGPGGQGTVFSPRVGSQELRIVHAFRSDGLYPTSTLLPGTDGVMYGTTYYGGTGNGTAFALRGGTFVETFNELSGGNGNYVGDLSHRGSGLMATTTARILALSTKGETSSLSQFAAQGTPVDAEGAIYAGTDAFSLSGSIVKFVDGEATLLHAFSGPDGANPWGGLMRGSDGALYGTTREGGAFGHGTIFRLRLDGTLTTLHHFSGADGRAPMARLSEGADQTALYGTTQLGGVSSAGSPDGAGTVFRISKTGEFALLHAFGPGQGAQPLARLFVGGDDTLFGTTFAGGTGSGTVFSIGPTGTFTTLHAFAAGQGAHPFGGVALGFDGALYGTTVLGGRANVGVIYRIRLP